MKRNGKKTDLTDSEDYIMKPKYGNMHPTTPSTDASANS